MKKLFLLLFVLYSGGQLFAKYTAEFVNKTDNFVEVTVRQDHLNKKGTSFKLWPQGTIKGKGIDYSRK